MRALAGAHLRPGGSRLPDGPGRSGQSVRRRDPLYRGRHVHQAQADGGGRGLHRRCPRQHRRRPGVAAAGQGQRHLQEAGDRRRGQSPARRHPGGGRGRLRAAAAVLPERGGAAPAAALPAGGGGRGRPRAPGAAGQRHPLLLPQRQQGGRGGRRSGGQSRAVGGEELHQGRHGLRRLQQPAQAGGGSDPGGPWRRGGQGVVRALRLRPSGALSPGPGGRAEELRGAAGQARPGAGVRHLQADGGLHPGVPLERARAGEAPPRVAGYQRRLPCEPAKGRHLFGGAAHPGGGDHPGGAHHHRRSGAQVRPLHQDHRRPAHRSLRRPGRPAARHLGRAGGGGLRDRSGLRQVGAHREVLRGLHLVSLRGAGLHDPDPDPGAPLQGAAGATQAEVCGLRLHPGVRRGPEQGHRRHRHRAGLEPLCVRQRRHAAAPRRPLCHGSRRADPDPLHRPAADVLRAHRGQAATHLGLDGEHGRGARLSQVGDHRGQARHRCRAGGHDGGDSRHLAVRVEEHIGGSGQAQAVRGLRQPARGRDAAAP